MQAQSAPDVRVNSGPARQLLMALWFQVLIASVAGALLGHFAPGLGAACKPLGDAFIALVRMMIGPIVFCTVVHGIAGLADMRRVGRLALKSLLYFEGVTTLALVISLAVTNLWQPGAGMNIDPARIDTAAVAPYVEKAHEQTIAGFFLGIVPDSFMAAFTGGQVLQVLFVAVLFGLALGSAGESGARVSAAVEKLGGVFARIIGLIMHVAPLGAFGSLAFTVGKFGIGALASLGNLIACFFAVCAIFTVVVFGVIARIAGVSLWRLIAYMRDEVVIVAATTSTEVVLPRVLDKMARAGCDEGVVGFVVPAGYSFNLDGTCLYLTCVALFLAQATNTPLTLGHQLVLIGVLLLTSKGAAGVAGAAFVVLAATLAAVGTIPVASIALILGIHRILAEGLTFVNLIGNCLAAIVVSAWEGRLDRDQLRAALAPA
jgi:aerobic C4-dicarboxylate transport protein